MKLLLQSDSELLVSEMQKNKEKEKKMGITNFVSELKHVENYPDFEKLVHIT